MKSASVDGMNITAKQATILLCYYFAFYNHVTQHSAGINFVELKGMVRSKISRGYVKVDGLGEALLFSRTKSDKNLPRYGASNQVQYNSLKT